MNSNRSDSATGHRGQQGHELAWVRTFGLLSSRDFSVEGVADPQLENRGQGVGPAWNSQLSPDSALSDGSTGSLEQQPDAGQSSTVLLTCAVTVASLVWHFLFPLCTSCFRHGLSESGQLCWKSGGGRRQELSEEPL